MPNENRYAITFNDGEVVYGVSGDIISAVFSAVTMRNNQLRLAHGIGKYDNARQFCTVSDVKAATTTE